MKKLLNGYGRIYIYSNYNRLTVNNKNMLFGTDNPGSNQLIEVQEGLFDNGLLNGFGRKLKIDGTAEVGYFENGRKSGKVIVYSNGMLSNQGIYKNDELIKR